MVDAISNQNFSYDKYESAQNASLNRTLFGQFIKAGRQPEIINETRPELGIIVNKIPVVRPKKTKERLLMINVNIIIPQTIMEILNRETE